VICAAAPELCQTASPPQKALLWLKSRIPDSKDQLIWKAVKGTATTKAEFGDPLNSDSYAFCIYDNDGLVMATTVAAGGTCSSKPCWKEKTLGFMFKDKTFANGGIQTIFLKEGMDGKAKFIVKGKGANLSMRTDLTTLFSPVTVQLKNSLGNCWGAVYTFPPAKKNDALNFKDTSD
jgi:hypothetical protein